jgi:hypothetical protein
MKRWVSRISLSLTLALSVALHASAQTETWNQEKTAALAGELESAVSGLRDAVRKSPAWENPQQKRTLYRIADKLRLIESESASLHAQLVKGAGMDETLPTYERIQRLKRDAQVLAKKTDVSAFTKPKLDRATEVLSQIAPYYPPRKEPKP